MEDKNNTFLDPYPNQNQHQMIQDPLQNVLKYESTLMLSNASDAVQNQTTLNSDKGECTVMPTNLEYMTERISIDSMKHTIFAPHGQKRKATIIKDESQTKKGMLAINEEKKNNHLRKNIRDVMNENNLDTITLKAQREESERLARVADQQKSMREIRKQVVHKNFFRILNLDDSEVKCGTSSEPRDNSTIILPDDDIASITCDESNSSLSGSVDDIPNKDSDGPPNDVVTIDDSSDDDCILLSEDDELEDYNEGDDATNSGMHVKDLYNIPDEYGRVVVNIAHPEGEETLYLAPQIAKVIKPHQIGGVRFLYDNIIESTRRFKKSGGFGCILAHSMGLGKTLQVVSFCDIFLRHTSAKTVLCVMPINTLQNWLSEFNMWIPRQTADTNIRTRNFEIFVLNDQQKNLTARAKVILNWAHNGGVLLIGYELFRLLALKLVTTRKRKGNKNSQTNSEHDSSKNLMNLVFEALVKPGPDLIICDEGHRIKNSHAGISLALKQIRTRRRIVLTGYPLQNNLLEYWCMVDFVRPNYLGTRTEFCNMFERPIQNGQCIDSTPDDIKLMRYRAHVLHSLLLGFVQRRSHTVLQSTLPQKLEYVILVKMTSFQRKLYDTFMTDVVRKKAFPNPLKAFAVCCKIWNHPDVLYNYLKKCETDLDLDEIDEESTKNPTSVAVDTNLCINDNTVAPIINQKGSEGNNVVHNFNESAKSAIENNSIFNKYGNKSCGNYSSEKEDQLNYGTYSSDGKTNYWLDPSIPSKPSYVEVTKQTDSSIEKDFDTITGSSEIVDLDTNEIKRVDRIIQSTIINQQTNIDSKKAKSIENTAANTVSNDSSRKILKPRRTDEFSCSWAVDLMKNYVSGQIASSPKMEIFFCIMKESILMGDRILLFSQSLLTLNLIEGFLTTSYVPDTTHLWIRNCSYFRLDGSTSSQERERLVNEFNSNPNIKLFLISTRAGSLGINLTGANRVIIFDASWNPCHDTQAVYRIYRYGQTKPCYVYRIVMDKCLEKKIYDRQIKKQGMSDRIVDECNPEAHLSIKDITNLCHDYGSDDDHVDSANDKSIKTQNNTFDSPSSATVETITEDQSHPSITHMDPLINTILKLHANYISKAPFLHESLLVDQKDRKLSQAEKRQAHRSYELEKKASVNQKFTYASGKVQYKVLNQDGVSISRPVASIKPLQIKNNNVSGGRSTRWIPAEVWQRQGMTAQEMTLPLDVVIPTNSSEKSNIILKAGQRVMVLKSSKGIYMQLDSGKIIAIRTTSKRPDAESINKDDVIDITSDCDTDTPKANSADQEKSIEKLPTKNTNITMISKECLQVAIDPNLTETSNLTDVQQAQQPQMIQDILNNPLQTKPHVLENDNQSQKLDNFSIMHQISEGGLEYQKQQQSTQKHDTKLSIIDSYNSSFNVQPNASHPPHTIIPSNDLTENSYFQSKNVQYSFPTQYYNYYDNKNTSSTTNYHINNYSPYSHFNFNPYHSNLHASPGYSSSSAASYINSNMFPRQSWNSVGNHQSNNESIRQQQYMGNPYSINEWSSQ